MSTQLTPGEDDQAAVMVCIGNVCVQWALLEQNIMAILSACQTTALDENAILFGSLDMKPRLNMAINLAEHHQWKPSIIKRLRALRKIIDRDKLVDRRNLIVHGVHSASPTPEAFNLYTPRRKGDAQREEWTILEAADLGVEISLAGREAYDIFLDFGRWKFGENFKEDPHSEIVATGVTRKARIKQYLRTRINRILR